MKEKGRVNTILQLVWGENSSLRLLYVWLIKLFLITSTLPKQKVFWGSSIVPAGTEPSDLVTEPRRRQFNRLHGHDDRERVVLYHLLVIG